MAIPSSTTPNAAIYPFWDDLLLDASSQVRTAVTGTAPNRQFIIEYRNATFFQVPTSVRLDFEVVLGENGDIDFHYRNLGPDVRELGNSATIGIENRNGTDALQISFNTAALDESRSLRFDAPPSAFIAGVVTDNNDGQPVSGASVKVSQGGDCG